MSNEKKTIKEWAADDRPREKMMTKGKSALSNAELIAILIGSGNSKQSAVELARSVLDSVNNNLIDLSNLSIKELMRHNGIGEAKAITIVAALELGRRRRAAEANLTDTFDLNNTQDAYERFLPYIDDFSQEHFLVMYLNNTKKILKIECVSIGGLSRTIADPRIVFRNAINLGATHIVIAHNHPSGNTKPSNEDHNLTKKFVACGNLMDIIVLDHIVIGNGKYHSFHANGEMLF
jgi:DNA repair protein RadC